MSEKAVAALVASHGRFLSFLERRVGNRGDAQEILQAAFVRGLERAGDIRDGEGRRDLEERAAEVLARNGREAADPELDFPTRRSLRERLERSCGTCAG
jgi:hypothetical protein